MTPPHPPRDGAAGVHGRTGEFYKWLHHRARLEIARKHLEAWLAAELEVTTHQSYTIGSRSLTKADLSEIGERIKYWTNEVSRLENIEARGGRNRVFRVVPRDL